MGSKFIWGRKNMATALFNTTTRSSNLYLHHHSILPRLHFSRRNISLQVTPRRLRRIAVAGGPPPPPSPDPPPPENSTQLEVLLWIRSCGSSDKGSRPGKDLPRSAILDVSLLLGYSD
ncbi:uncharacterized protein LOC108807202 isoform X2 [Raphanus sativus]|uniref:Uncharacterized protein LOC108807202 isoform X2 n=1 Tax=Raphanus sativus TaxID=3726 RepID=A0A9W3CWB4_RAPSA|nr:uncharacterized protein LOC108807202 isoform X2 [Raphanus sativus]